jgi:hypothetical protein
MLAQERLGRGRATGNRPLQRVRGHLLLRLLLLPWLLALRLLPLLLQRKLLALGNGKRAADAAQTLVDLGRRLEVALVHGDLGLRGEIVHLARHALDLGIDVSFVVGAAAPLGLLRNLHGLIALSRSATMLFLRLRASTALVGELLLQIAHSNLGLDHWRRTGDRSLFASRRFFTSRLGD